MNRTRIISLTIAGIYLAPILVVLLRTPLKSEELVLNLIHLFGFLAWVLFSLVCIWFGEDFGSWIGSYRFLPFIEDSNVSTVVFLGWILLLLPLVIFLGSVVLRKI